MYLVKQADKNDIAKQPHIVIGAYDNRDDAVERAMNDNGYITVNGAFCGPFESDYKDNK